MTIFLRSQESGSLNIVLEITCLQLQKLPKPIFHSLDLQEGLYLKVINPETNKVFFTSSTDDLHKLCWTVQIPLYIFSSSKPITFKLGGVLFGDFNMQERLEPWEIMSFQFNLDDLEHSLFFTPQKKTLEKPEISEKMISFLRRRKTYEKLETLKVKEFFQFFFYFFLKFIC